MCIYMHIELPTPNVDKLYHRLLLRSFDTYKTNSKLNPIIPLTVVLLMMYRNSNQLRATNNLFLIRNNFFVETVLNV